MRRVFPDLDKEQRVSIERLGAVTVPSGVLMVIDTGLLNLWSHDAAPVFEGDSRTAEIARSAVDFRVEGRDAEAAGRAFARQWNPRFLFDIPQHVVEQVNASFAACVKERGLNASLVVGDRVPHRSRVDFALKAGDGAGEVQFHGIPAVAISGLPTKRELTVVGERMDEPPFEDCWRWVALEVRDDVKMSRFVEAGTVAVDCARLMFVDVDALGAWRHDESVDNKADVVFWGLEADAVAKRVGAERIGSDFGWKDLPIAIAIERADRIEAMRNAGEFKFAFDFRPHSDHYRILEQMRASPTESGTIELGESLTTGFFTQWGDGFFPVRLGLGPKNELVRVQIDLATPQAIKNMKAVNGLE